MKRLLFLFIPTITFLFISTNAYAISATSAIVIDSQSGRVLYSHNAEEKRGMASTTKIMTALCALEYGDLEKIVTISPTASAVEGSSMYLAKGEKIKLADLVYGLMLVSGNDAATAIAESVSGSTEKFSALMNKKAMEIGAYSTNFTNPHGLSDENHYTTAHDLAKIAAYAIKNPTLYEIGGTKTKKLAANEGGYPRTLVNHNKLLSMYDSCTFGKTGFTKACGRCLVTAAEKNGLRLVCVTLNAPDDWSDHTALYNDAFSKYHMYKYQSKDTEQSLAKVQGGVEAEVLLQLKDDLLLPIIDGEESKITSTVEVFEDLHAPIRAGDILGTMFVSVDNKPCGEYPLVAKTDVLKKQAVFTKTSTFGQNLKKIFVAWLTCFQNKSI